MLLPSPTCATVVCPTPGHALVDAAQGAVVVVSRTSPGCAGVFAHGHLGESTRYLLFDLLDDARSWAAAPRRSLASPVIQGPGRVAVRPTLGLRCDFIWVTCRSRDG